MGSMRNVLLWGLEPPGAEASRPKRLRFVRALCVRQGAVVLVLGLLAAVIVGQTWLVIVVCALAIVQVVNIVWIDIKLRQIKHDQEPLIEPPPNGD